MKTSRYIKYSRTQKYKKNLKCALSFSAPLVSGGWLHSQETTNLYLSFFLLSRETKLEYSFILFLLLHSQETANPYLSFHLFLFLLTPESHQASLECHKLCMKYSRTSRDVGWIHSFDNVLSPDYFLHLMMFYD